MIMMKMRTPEAVRHNKSRHSSTQTLEQGVSASLK